MDKLEVSIFLTRVHTFTVSSTKNMWLAIHGPTGTKLHLWVDGLQLQRLFKCVVISFSRSGMYYLCERSRSLRSFLRTYKYVHARNSNFKKNGWTHNDMNCGVLRVGKGISQNGSAAGPVLRVW